MEKLTCTILLIAIMISGLAFVSSVPFGKAQTSTSVNGIIYSDVTWTKANSPYILTGPVAVNKGVTLTIEPGVSVNGGFYIQVNGTLIARGTSSDPINLDAQIQFMSVSNSWNQQTGFGSIIENTLNSNITITGCSPRVDSNTLYGLSIEQASPTISNNQFLNEISVSQSSSNIVNNTITGISINGGSPTISNNTITSSNDYDSNYAAIVIIQGSPIIANNLIKSRVDITEPHIMMPSERLVYPGIVINYANNALIIGNAIDDCLTGITSSGSVTIENNFINSSKTAGIDVTGGNAVIQNNTITYNQVGINSSSPSSVIAYNNIQNNSWNIYYTSPNNFNATYNWWGTTDIQEINQTIHDNKNDFNLGTVNFVPFLTAPNPQAMPNPSAPIPIADSSSPTSTPVTPEFSSSIYVAILLIAVLLTISIAKRKIKTDLRT